MTQQPLSYLTEQDEQNYGRDLIDFAQRAAAHAVAPHLQNLEQQNAQLAQRLAVEARRNMDAAVERAVPDYREIDRNPNWHQWLLGVDTLSGRIRQQLLNDAIQHSDVGRVVSFFRQFQNSGETTGQTHGHTRQRRAGAPSGSGPIYTNESIAAIYANRRKGLYSEEEWARLEADLFAAQKENRLAVKMFLSK